jgi:NitT/TauT family transport system substrate-binding protein
MLTDILEELLPKDVSIEWVNINNSADIRDSLVTGRIDVATVNIPNFITAYENGLPVTLLSNYIVQTAFIYSTRADILSLNDISRGDRLASTGIGTAYHLTLMLVAKEMFGNAARFDENIVVMDNADMVASVETSNDLDLIMLGFPSIIRADEIASLTPIFDLTPVMQNHNISFVTVTRDNFYDNNPVLIEILYEAFRQAISFIIEHPGDAASLLAGFYGNVSAEDIKHQLISAPPQLEISESGYNGVAELMYEVGMIPNPPTKLANFRNYESIPRVP